MLKGEIKIVFLDDEQRSDDESSLKIGNVVVLSSCRRSFSSFVNLRSVRVMLQLCLGYVRSIRVMSGSVEVCQGLQGSIQVCQTPPSGSVKVHQGFSGSVNVRYGLSGFVLVRSGSCKGSVKTVQLFSSSLRLKQGFQSCYYKFSLNLFNIKCKHFAWKTF